MKKPTTAQDWMSDEDAQRWIDEQPLRLDAKYRRDIYIRQQAREWDEYLRNTSPRSRR